MSALICPVDGVRLLRVDSTNAQGDPVHRWECPTGDWCGPWYAGEPSDESEALPELSRRTMTVQTTCDVVEVTGPGSSPVNVNVTADETLYAEDSVHISGDLGRLVLGVRNDSGAPLAADGDYIPLTTDANGALNVTAVSVNEMLKAEDSPHASGDLGRPAWFVRNDTHAVLTDTDLDYTPPAVDADGAVQISDGGNIISVDDGGGSITVDTTSGPISVNVSADATLKAEDSPHISGDLGRNVWFVRNDSNAVLTDTDLDYIPPSTDSTGALHVVSGPTALNVSGTVNIGATGVFDPGVPGQVVSGSAWSATGFASIMTTGGSLIVQSPVPGTGQRIVVSWWDYHLQITANLSAPLTNNVNLRQAGGGTIYWQSTYGLVATAKAAETIEFETSRHIIVGAVNQRLEIIIPVAALVNVDLSANLGGYQVL